jgi:arylformamidase
MDDLIDWEDAFSNAAYIPQGMTYPDRWSARAAEFRAQAKVRLDIPYGPTPRECFDLFLPKATPRGLAVFIHGGFWLDFDKSSWSDLAAGALAHGWAVALPQYTLAPAARISDITRQVGAAVAAAATRIDGPIRLAGHSAGGHLATRMICANGPLSPDVAARVEKVVSISGVHDLRPLRHHSMNQQLQLSEAEALAESPALQVPLPGSQLVAWVGSNERPEFLRQSALLREAWGERGVMTDLIADPGHHHFDVIDGLKSPTHPLNLCFAGP